MTAVKLKVENRRPSEAAGQASLDKSDGIVEQSAECSSMLQASFCIQRAKRPTIHIPVYTQDTGSLPGT